MSINATESVVIDGLLKEIGDRLFYGPVVSMKARRLPTGLKLTPLTRKSSKSRGDYISRTLRNTVLKRPEVMVKISGGGTSFTRTKAHLEYISRNGEVQLEDQDGNVFSGRAELRDLQREWRYGGYPMTDKPSIKQSYNIVLSMPPGTDRQAVTNAARDFAKTEFGENYSYVFASHEDTSHPHVHLCVKAMGLNGIRLSPRKPDLQHYRQLFAEKLIDHGIEANATLRPVRGKVRRPVKQAVVHMEHRGVRSKHREALKSAAEGFIRHGTAISNPLKPKIQRTRQFVVESWNAIGHALQAQGAEKLSAEVKAFVHALHEPLGVGEQLEKQLRLQIKKQQQKNKEKGSER
jgi:type IV secretory pathway VirD2 relaxase